MRYQFKTDVNPKLSLRQNWAPCTLTFLKSVAFTVPPSLISNSYFFPVRLSTTVRVPAPPEKFGAVSAETVKASSIGEAGDPPASKWPCKIDSLFMVDDDMEAAVSLLFKLTSIAANKLKSSPHLTSQQSSNPSLQTHAILGKRRRLKMIIKHYSPVSSRMAFNRNNLNVSGHGCD